MSDLRKYQENLRIAKEKEKVNKKQNNNQFIDNQGEKYDTVIIGYPSNSKNNSKDDYLEKEDIVKDENDKKEETNMKYVEVSSSLFNQLLKSRNRDWIRVGTFEKQQENNQFTSQNRSPVYISYGNLFEHTLNLGSSGMGKTALVIKPIVQQVLPLNRCGIIVFDIKQDLALEVYAIAQAMKVKGLIPESREVYFFNPALENCMYVNILKEAPDRAFDYINTIIKKQSKGGESSEYFENNNKSAIQSALRIVKETKKIDAVISDIYYILSNETFYNEEKQKLKEMYNELADESNYAKIQNENVRLLGTAITWLDTYWMASTETKGVFNDTSAKNLLKTIMEDNLLSRVFNVRKTEAEKLNRKEIDFRYFIKNKSILSVTCGGELTDVREESVEALGALLIIILQNTYLSTSAEDRVDSLLFIDEFQNFSNPGQKKLFQLGRSYRVGMHVATQETNSLDEDGSKEVQGFVLSNTATKFIHGGVSNEDANYLQSSFATSLHAKTIVQQQQNAETKTSENVERSTMDQVEETVFNPTNIQSLTQQELFFQSKYGLSKRKIMVISCSFANTQLTPDLIKLSSEFEKRYKIFIQEKLSGSIDNIIKHKDYIKKYSLMDSYIKANQELEQYLKVVAAKEYNNKLKTSGEIDLGFSNNLTEIDSGKTIVVGHTKPKSVKEQRQKSAMKNSNPVVLTSTPLKNNKVGRGLQNKKTNRKKKFGN